LAHRDGGPPGILIEFEVFASADAPRFGKAEVPAYVAHANRALHLNYLRPLALLEEFFNQAEVQADSTSEFSAEQFPAKVQRLHQQLLDRCGGEASFVERMRNRRDWRIRAAFALYPEWRP
jgi:hypothetical protein